MNSRARLARVVSPWIAAVLAGSAPAQEAVETRAETAESAPAARALPSFGPGTLLLAGESPMGARRLYPSPVLQDMNGDGRLDVVIGDLWGRITVAPRLTGVGPPRFGADEPLNTRDGSQLDFKNW